MLRFSSVIAVLASASGVFAQAGAAPAPKGGFGDPTFIFMMVAMFAIIYFLMLRPQAKKQKETQRMLNELKKGDKVLTVAGIWLHHATITHNSGAYRSRSLRESEQTWHWTIED